MKKHLYSALLLLILSPGSLYAARLSIDNLQTNINKLDAEVNEIDSRVSKLEIFHEDPPAVTFGLIEFEDFPRLGTIAIQSFELRNDSNGSLTGITVDISHNALIAELSMHAAMGTIFGVIPPPPTTPEYPGHILVNLTGTGFGLDMSSVVIDNLSYSKADPGITSLSLRFSSAKYIYDASGSCEDFTEPHFVDLADSSRTIEAGEISVSAFAYYVQKGATTPIIQASVNAILGDKTGCALQKFITGRQMPAVLMERFSDSVDIKQAALSTTLKDAFISSFNLNPTPAGNIETNLTFVFKQLYWSSLDDVGNTTQGSWDLLTNTPAPPGP